jgi:tubulin polyglutamylase TTLL4
VCPSLSSSSPFDKKVKTTLLSDIFNMVGLEIYDKKKYEKMMETTVRKRLRGLDKPTKQSGPSRFDMKKHRLIDEVEELGENELNLLMEHEEELHR